MRTKGIKFPKGIRMKRLHTHNMWIVVEDEFSEYYIPEWMGEFLIHLIRQSGKKVVRHGRWYYPYLPNVGSCDKGGYNNDK